MNRNSSPVRLLDFATLAPVVAGSRAVALAAAAWRRIAVAVEGSALTRAVRAASQRMKSVGSATAIVLVSWAVVTAATTHLLMLGFVERYHYPRRTALVLPAVVAIAALLACVFSADIARALVDKRDH